MIGGSKFGEVFGGIPHGDTSFIPHAMKAAIKTGWSPVLLQPGGKEPGCILAPRTALAADRERQQQVLMRNPSAKVDKIRHECGFKHVIDDPAKVNGIYDRFVKRYGGANLGLHLGRSRLMAVDVDTPDELNAFAGAWSQNIRNACPPLTVESPGFYDPKTQTWVHHGGGHWWFELPEGFEASGKVYKAPGGWAAMYGESFVLVPPSVRPEGPYRLTGADGPAPEWLIDQVSTAARVRESKAEYHERAASNTGPIDAWSARTPWAELLEPRGWSEAGTVHSCGCPNWTGPEGHANPKSATAHDLGCAVFDVDEGWGPLHIWTDHPPDGLPPEGTVTKVQFLAICYFDGSVSRALTSVGIENPNRPADAFKPPDSWGSSSGTQNGPETRNPLQESYPDHRQFDDKFQGASPPDPTSPAGGELTSRGRVLDALLDSNDLEQIPDAVPLIEGVIDRNTVAVLAGKFGTYKSFLAIDWAACLATGKPWNQQVVPEAVPVLYVAAEGASGIKKRRRAWVATHGPIPRGALIVLPLAARLNVGEEVEQLDIALKETGAKLMILDTLHRSAPGLEENDNTEIGRMLAIVDLLRERNNVAVLLVHHTGHGGARSRGGSSLEDDADTVFVIKLDGDGEDRSAEVARTLHHRKTKDAELLHPMALTFKAVEGTGSGVLTTDPFIVAPSRNPALADEALAYITDHPGESQNSIATALGVQKRDLGPVLRKLETGGLVRVDTSSQTHRHYPKSSIFVSPDPPVHKGEPVSVRTDVPQLHQFNDKTDGAPQIV